MTYTSGQLEVFGASRGRYAARNFRYNITSFEKMLRGEGKEPAYVEAALRAFNEERERM